MGLRIGEVAEQELQDRKENSQDSKRPMKLGKSVPSSYRVKPTKEQYDKTTTRHLGGRLEK